MNKAKAPSSRRFPYVGLWILAVIVLPSLSQSLRAGSSTLFPTDLPGKQSAPFYAVGYSKPVVGTIYRAKDTVDCGLALGGVDTGCLDLETNGMLGYGTIFNSHVPRRGPIGLPLFGMSVGGSTWVLAAERDVKPGFQQFSAWNPGGQTELGANQPAWAIGEREVPGIFKSIGASKYDLPAGKVGCHGPVMIRWTSPVEGEIVIDGGVWMPRNMRRPQKWELYHNGALVTSGRLPWGPTSSEPLSFDTGRGGTAALTRKVRKGDIIELSLSPYYGSNTHYSDANNDFIGVDFRILDLNTNQVWDLASDWSDSNNPNGPWIFEVSSGPASFSENLYASGVKTAKEIHYWGHYPIADLEYETDAPVSVGLRAWSPFLPGNLRASMIPGIVFEAYLRNTSTTAQKGTLAFTFPGPNAKEAPQEVFQRREVKGHFSGVVVSSPKASYTIGAVGSGSVRVGGELANNGDAWAGIHQSLPQADNQSPGSAVAVDFNLKAGEEKTVRFILTWHSPEWTSRSSSGGSTFIHMYEKYYPDPLATAGMLAEKHESLLQRIIAWQEVIYSDSQLPGWLKDPLINNLYHITEVGLWAQAKASADLEWVSPEDGIWGMIESPRSFPQIECIPCSFYGNIPIVYFFPELAVSTLRAYKEYQLENGRPAWIFGDRVDMTSPIYNDYQAASNGVCIVEMVNKMWLRSGDDALLEEFYDMAKRATIYSMTLAPEYRERGVIAMPTINKKNSTEWFESVKYHGVASHVGGLRLAQLKLAKRMAEKMEDAEFVEQCDEWFSNGSKYLEEDLWRGTHYGLFYEPANNYYWSIKEQRNDTLMSWVLDGEWIARFHGQRGVFPEDRTITTLDTIAKANADNYIPVTFINADGSKPAPGNTGYWGNNKTHAPSSYMLGMTYMYMGQPDEGLRIVQGVLDLLKRNGRLWNWPLNINLETEEMISTDYYQNMMLWSVPAALQGQALDGPCREGGLVDRMIKAVHRN